MSADGKKNLLEAIQQGREEEVERLVRQGEDVNSVFFFNRTPLHCAVAKKMTRMVEMILRLNPDVKVKRINGKVYLKRRKWDFCISTTHFILFHKLEALIYQFNLLLI